MNFTKYENYKASEIDWLEEIPSHWSTKKIKFCCTFNQTSLREDSDPELEIDYVDIGSVSQGRIGHVESHIFKEAPSRARRIAKKGDTILSTVRTYLKAISYVEEDYADCIFSTGFAVLSPKYCFEGKFFSYLLQSESLINEVVRFSKGVSFPAITSWELGSFFILIPPIEEQKRIVEFLDRKTAEIDQAIAQKQRLIELLKEQKAILIDRAVTQGIDPNVEMRETNIGWLNKIPSHWKINRIKRLFSEIDDRSVDGKEILLSLRMYAGLVPHNDVSDKPIESNALVGYRRVNRGELVMNRMRAAIGLFGVADISGIVSPDYAVFRKIEDIHMDFYLHLFKTESMKKIFFLESKGIGTGSSGFLRLYSDKFGTIKVPVAPMEEQKRILNYIQEVESEHSILEKKTEQEINCLVEIKNILICDSVTGKMKL